MKPSALHMDAAYSLFFQESATAMWIFDIEKTRVIDINQEALRIYSLTREQALELSVSDLIDLAQLTLFRQALTTLRRHSESASYEPARRWKTRRRRGAAVEIEMTWRRTRLGSTDAVLGVFRDITSIVRDEAIATVRETSLAVAQRLTHFGTWWAEFKEAKAAEAHTVSWSEETCRIFGYPPKGVTPTSALFLSHVIPEDRDRVWQIVRQSMKKKRPYEIEYHIRTGTGDERTIVEGGQVTELPGGEGLRLGGVIIDITERRRAQENRSLLSSVIDVSEDAIVTTTTDGIVTSWSNGAEKLYGYDAGSMVGKSIERVIAPEDRAEYAQRFARVLAGAPVERVESVRRTRDDRRIRVSVSQSALRAYVGGRVTGMVSVERDLTDRKRVEEQTERFFKLSLDLLGICGFDGRFKRLNPAWETVLGYSRDELTSRPIFDFVHPDDLPATKGAMEQLVTGHVLLNFESRHIAKDGTVKVLAWTAIPEPDAQLIYASARDMTERIRMERMLRQSEKMSGIGQLAAGVAHELNNPLNVILGFAQSAAAKVDLGDSLYTPLKWIEKETLRCRDLIRNLLNFSREGKPTMAPGDLRHVLTEATDLIRTQARVRKVEVVTAFAALPLTVPFDRVQMQQVLINLCTNALDAMPAGGTLTLRTRVTQETVEFAVTDTGTGIPENLRQQIFEPFFTTKEPGKGTGLGLSLVYEIVQNHHGHITVDSLAGKGSTFTISIPAHAPHASVLPHPSAPEKPSENKT